MMTASKCWWERDSLSFELNATSREDAAGTVLIGLGNANPGMTQHGVHLNQKGYFAAKLRSVSQLIHEADAAQREVWHERLPNTSAIRKIVVEDFSLDTCFALLRFGACLDCETFADVPGREWLDYVSDWENGRFVDGPDLQRSAACLFSALGHSYIPEDIVDVKVNGFVTEGMHACLRLLSHMCRMQASPLSGIDAISSREYARAIAQLTHERQMYLLVLQRARQCQLLVDLDSSDRRLVIDALFLTETLPGGIIKIMARTDHEHTWTKRGFGLLAIYRPGERGTGNDMAVSVDPTTGTQLGRLWRRLEELENLRWGQVRPCDAPRVIESYRDSDDPRHLIAGAPNQPWYDDGGHYTLIAAPKAISTDELGTRLGWVEDVVPALWELYFNARINAFVTEDLTPGIADDKLNKRVRRFYLAASAGSDGTLNPDRTILETPTFHAWLAAQTASDAVVDGPFKLPPQGSYEVLHIGSIIAVIHRDGVTLYCDHADVLRTRSLAEMANTVALASTDYDTFLQKYLTKLTDWASELTQSPVAEKASRQSMSTARRRNLDEWTHDIIHVKAEALAALSNMTLLDADYDHNRLSHDLQRLWGLSEQRSELLALIDRVDELMRQTIAARTEKRQRIYGGILSALGLGFAASHIWEPIKNRITTNMYEWQVMILPHPSKLDKQLREIADQSANLETLTIFIILAFSLIGFVLYWIFGIRGSDSE